MDKDDKPIGDKWSFDTENRLPLPKNHIPIPIKHQPTNKYIKEAIKYINDNFPSNYGDLSEDNFIFPIDNTRAKRWLKLFLKNQCPSSRIYSLK